MQHGSTKTFSFKKLVFRLFPLLPIVAFAYGPGLTKTISPYAGGIAIGPFMAMSEPFADQSKASLKISFANELILSEWAGIFIDYNYFVPDRHHGLDMGADVFLLPGPVKPLVGFGVGAHYINKDGQKFADSFGPSATAHIGVSMDINPNLQMRMRIPYHVIGNKDYDQGLGVDISFLFSMGWSHIPTINP